MRPSVTFTKSVITAVFNKIMDSNKKYQNYIYYLIILIYTLFKVIVACGKH